MFFLKNDYLIAALIAQYKVKINTKFSVREIRSFMHICMSCDLMIHLNSNLMFQILKHNYLLDQKYFEVQFKAYNFLFNFLHI